jgi:hypothetical protein
VGVEVNEDEVKKWYRENGMEYIPSDWGPRSDTGESAGSDLPKDRFGGNSEMAHSREFPVHFWPNWAADENAGVGAMWPPREDQEEVDALDEFFAPYYLRLPQPKANLLMDYFGARNTQSELAGPSGVTQQAISKDLKSAVRALTRLIAEDCPTFNPPEDGRKRDDAEEGRAAQEVLNTWWYERFGKRRL